MNPPAQSHQALRDRRAAVFFVVFFVAFFAGCVLAAFFGISRTGKERFRTRIQQRKQPDGSVEETLVERAEYDQLLVAVRALYLDIARWAAEEPSRWRPWAAPCPIKEAEVSNRKRVKWRKARMDQRTRERLPVLDTFVRAAADHHAQESAAQDDQRGQPELAEGDYSQTGDRGGWLQKRH
ncbi:hypothetical protein [Streptomyces griseorubiginosus]|uniref:hypothetical protein n=1 Tax=Streptomyces griseorubiginosus TaxID=67304 RepID=UPI003646D643